MSAQEPKPRKVPSKTHKCFGRHSRVLTQTNIDNEPWTKTQGRRAGSKQIAPGEYGCQKSDFRTRAERRNAAERLLVRKNGLANTRSRCWRTGSAHAVPGSGATGDRGG